MAQGGSREARYSLQQELVTAVSPPIAIQRYRSFCQLIVMSMFLCISALIFGYSLTQISTVPMDELQIAFNIPGKNLLSTQGLLTGTMPIGGIFGGFVCKLFLELFSRRNAHFVVAIITLIATILTEIPFLPSLYLGRFVLGIACGVYTSIAPVYIKEIAPKQKRSQLGSFFIVCKVFGIVLSYALGLIFYQAHVSDYWRYIFMMPGILAIIQVIGILLFIPHSPVEMVEKQDLAAARLTLLTIYEKQYVDDVLSQMMLDYKAQIAKTQAMEGLNEIVGQSKSFRKNRARALIMGVHIAILRQFIGVNCLAAYSQDIILPYDSRAAIFTPLVINSVQLVGTIIALTYMTKVFMRRTLFHIGVGLMTVFSFGIALFLLFETIVPALVFMNLYMFTNGATLGAVAWAYPAEIVPPSKQPIITFFSWVGISCVTIFPPIIISIMPNNNSYPLFFFFAFWGLWSFVYDWFYLVESKGRTYEKIISQF